AVDVVLPILAMPDVVAKALKVGKHVISEKPIAPTVEVAQALLSLYGNYPRLTWMVAENWRYEAAFIRAAEVIERSEIGQPILCHWALHVPMRPDASKYYKTLWRRSGDFPGGLLMDGGVHHVAAMRRVIGEIAEVSATVAQIKSDLSPAD